jgi:nucleotide-binding universal stress UspA family protein
MEAVVKILFATDGGAPALQALSLLERVAAPTQGAITVVTVGSRDSSLVKGEGLAPEDILGSAVKRLHDAGFTADLRVLDGRPAAAIVEEIIDGDFELTVLGAGNRSRLGRILMGSVSTKVLHASPSSVLIVHRVSELEHPIRVLFGTDGSQYADLAVDQMIGFLNPSSCEVDVVSVAEHLMPVISFPIPREAYATSAPTPQQEKEWMNTAQGYATASTAKLEAAGFKSTARARLGSPSLQLLDESDRIDADLVVVGSTGLGALQRATLGSVSDQMVRNTPAAFVARGSRPRGC